MIVAYSRAIAMKIYKRILELHPGWTEKIGVVMTDSNKDPEEWRAVIGNKKHREELAKKFKDNNSPMKIAIVVDMWLTGFDVPSLATMYVYKPMQGYNLMQAIARVNRVFCDKEGGLVVDYVGIASALKEAMNDYTSRDKKNYGDTDVAKVAYPKFLEKLTICRDLFHGYDYSKFVIGTDLERSKTISGAVNFIVAVDKERERNELPALKDISIAKNYLSESELKVLNNLVSGYFDFAEINAIEHKPMYMNDYVEQLDSILASGNRQLLVSPGKVSHKQAITKASEEYRKFQEITIAPVEEAYLGSIKLLEKEAKQKTRSIKR